MEIPHEIEKIYSALKEAGSRIVGIEESGSFSIEYKTDQSPLTIADKTSDSLLKKTLAKISPGISVHSEENNNPSVPGECVNRFWLLDPLDGTKEFINGNGEYCISLALINNGRPVEGYIYWPARKVLWYAIKGEGAYRVTGKNAYRLPLEEQNNRSSLVLLRSRSHYNKLESLWYEKATRTSAMEIKKHGSAIKFCLIAEGRADFYIKKGRIFGWDIAAGDLILRESGGRLVSYDQDKEIYYGFNNSEMPHFLACSSRIQHPEKWLF